MAVHITRVGDDDTAALGHGGRVPKPTPRISAYADTDETNAAIGTALAPRQPPERHHRRPPQILNELFDVGADLCTPMVADLPHQPLRITHTYIQGLESGATTSTTDCPHSTHSHGPVAPRRSAATPRPHRRPPR